jgi:H+-translocating NAD(P) transhydrogenase subunit alpha
MVTTVGVLREETPGEARVALVPDAVARLRSAGLAVLVESGAGTGAQCDDSTFEEAGAEPADGPSVRRRADVLVCVRPPSPERVAELRRGQVLVGLLEPYADPERAAAYARRGITAISLDLLPRTLSRAQAMDALTSQANVAGYKAVLVAANAYGRYLPLLMTAAGTAKPAQVLVLGVGVAGLAAIGTARRLGAVVTAYDIRPETRDEVRSLGARFLELPGVLVTEGAGGYARALTEEQRRVQQAALQERIADFDIVITTALVPGRIPPVLVTAQALKGMRPGSVVVDIAAGPAGGNVEGVMPDRSILTEQGVTLIGAGNLPSQMAAGASAAYARNIAAVLDHILLDGAPRIDLADEIQAAIVIAHDGQVRGATA